MLIRSTPVSAAAHRIVVRLMPPEASNSTAGLKLVPQRHGRPEFVGRHVVEKNNVRASRKDFGELLQRIDLDFDDWRGKDWRFGIRDWI